MHDRAFGAGGLKVNIVGLLDRRSRGLRNSIMRVRRHADACCLASTRCSTCDRLCNLRAMTLGVVPGLDRYVLPVSQLLQFEAAGFLLPPDGGWIVGSEEMQPRPVRDLAADRTSFVLLAAGGAGKTRTLRAMAEGDPAGVWIDIAALQRYEIDRGLSAVEGSDATVYVDGLDQAAVQDPALLHWLEAKLTHPAVAGIAWRLACRAAAWSSALSGALRRSRADFGEWRLLPLGRDGVRHAVARELGDGFDAPAFTEALARARLGTLSACVGQLLATARYWRGEGRLPAGGVEAMRYEVDELIREIDQHRPPSRSRQERVQLAQRVAAMLTFAREPVVGLTSGAAALSVDDLPIDPEPAEPSTRIEVKGYREVLGTSLFDVGPPGTVMFRHQRYGEFLAASYLAERRATPEQIADLLGARTSGVLPAATIPIVAWLAALTPESIRELVTDNAVALASASAAIELPDGRARAVVVDGLLTAAASGCGDPDWSVPPSALVHADVETQLARCLSNPTSTPEQLWCGAVGRGGPVPWSRDHSRGGRLRHRPTRLRPPGSGGGGGFARRRRGHVVAARVAPRRRRRGRRSRGPGRPHRGVVPAAVAHGAVVGRVATPIRHDARPLSPVIATAR